MRTLQMRENTTNGFLFTLCGLDGSGKTTMLTKLKEMLKKKYSVYITKQPTDAVRNSEIFRTYMDCPNHDNYDYRSLSLLAASDRLQHVNKVIEPEMQQGKLVISDRYFYSCLANLRARGFRRDKWIYEIAQSIVKPDLALFFDVPVETAIERVRSRAAEKDRYIDVALQYQLRDEYIAICKANNGILISTEMPIEESYSIVKKQVERVINMKIEERVKRILAKLSGQDNISHNMSLQNDLTLDSLAMVTLLVEIEDAFQIQLNESDMNPFDLNTVDDVMGLVKKYRGIGNE